LSENDALTNVNANLRIDQSVFVIARKTSCNKLCIDTVNQAVVKR